MKKHRFCGLKVNLTNAKYLIEMLEGGQNNQ